MWGSLSRPERFSSDDNAKAQRRKDAEPQRAGIEIALKINVHRLVARTDNCRIFLCLGVFALKFPTAAVIAQSFPHFFAFCMGATGMDFAWLIVYAALQDKKNASALSPAGAAPLFQSIK
jgi:hypothetical protein